MLRAVRFLLLLPLLAPVATTRPVHAADATTPFLQQSILFPPEPHSWYRIPSIVVARSGVVLAFAERRIGTSHDYGRDGESVLRRSFDHGKTWGPIQTIVSRKHLDPDSGPAVVDYETGRIFRTFKWVSSGVRSAEWDTEHPEEMKALGYASYEIHSDDDGETWSEPRNLNLSHPLAKSRLSVGNGNHGIQLGKWGPAVGPPSGSPGPHDGRLVIQGGWMAEAVWVRSGANMRGCFITSDDHGETWRVAGTYLPTEQDLLEHPGVVPGGMQVEYSLVELADRSIYANARSARDAAGGPAGEHPWRTVLWSHDGGDTMEGWRYQTGQVTGIHGGLARYDARTLLMSFATKPRRNQMSVSMSSDDGATWPVSKVVHEGPASYSDLAVTKEKTIVLIYEGGQKTWNEYIAVARFNREWLVR
jgi:sialidase-1